MSEEKKREEGELSRRDFIKGAGLIVGGAALSSTALIAGTPAETAAAQTTSGVTLEVLDPSGAFEVTTLNAPRLPTLEGKTVCFLSDNEWQAWRTFPLLADLLKKQFPTIKIVSWEEFPRDGDHGYPDFDKNPGLLKSKGCDAVILGNAG
jgi:hypothetical protein